MCLEITRRSNSVISTKLGKLSRNPEEACDETLFFDSDIQSTILISEIASH